MAARAVFAKFSQILVQLWQGECHFSNLERHFASSANVRQVCQVCQVWQMYIS